MDAEKSEDGCVYVVDDDAAVRRGIARLLKVSGYTCRVFEGAKQYLESRVDSREMACLVLDIRMPDISGTELQELLHGTEHDVPIVFVTGHGDIPTCVKALKAGAVSFLTKPFDEEALLTAVSEALRVSKRTTELTARRAEANKRFALLSPREREVLDGVVRGLLNKQIADELGIAEKTVKVHRGRVMLKMGVDSVAQLVRLTQAVSETAGRTEENYSG
jgi:FixJ family two-component response regulator